jgi:hypothetical protein
VRVEAPKPRLLARPCTVAAGATVGSAEGGRAWHLEAQGCQYCRRRRHRRRYAHALCRSSRPLVA